MSKKYIDAEEAKRVFAKMYRTDDVFKDALLRPIVGAMWDCLDQMPTKDVTEVVRCKDCAMYTGKYCTITNDEEDVREPNDFCSYGERRTDDGE